MSAHCDIHGCDLVYPAGTWPLGECHACVLEAEKERLREALEAIAGPSPRSTRPEVEQLRDAVKWRQGVARDALVRDAVVCEARVARRMCEGKVAERVTAARLTELHRGGPYPTTFEQIAERVTEGRDIGWYSEDFLVGEVERLETENERLKVEARDSSSEDVRREDG